MANPTFLNLPPNKQERFVDEALETFAFHGFRSASITQMVKNLGIAKGSVYQYFNDKQDLYNYLAQITTSRKFQILGFADSKASFNLTLWFIELCLAEMKFGQEFPKMYNFINRMKSEADPVIKHQVESHIQSDYNFISDRCTRFRNYLNPESDLQKVAFILTESKNYLVKSALLLDAGSDSFQHISSSATIIINGMTNQS